MECPLQLQWTGEVSGSGEQVRRKKKDSLVACPFSFNAILLQQFLCPGRSVGPDVVLQRLPNEKSLGSWSKSKRREQSEQGDAKGCYDGPPSGLIKLPLIKSSFHAPPQALGWYLVRYVRQRGPLVSSLVRQYNLKEYC
jgi:hypothetical protein